MPISSSWIIGIVISVIIAVLAIVIVIIAGKSGDLPGESTNSPTDSSIKSPESAGLNYKSEAEESLGPLIKRPTPWTKYKNPFTKKYIDSFSNLSPSVRKPYTIESIKSTLAATAIIDLYKDHLDTKKDSYAKWHTHPYAYPTGMVIFKTISDKMPDEIELGYGRKAVLLKQDGKILATFPNSDVDIKVSPKYSNNYANDNNPVLTDNNSWYYSFGAKYFKAEANNRSDPIMPILPPNNNCCRQDSGATGGGWIYRDDLWNDYRKKLTKIQSNTELSRNITREELKRWYGSNSHKFKFIPNMANIQSLNFSGNIEIPYFPVAMYKIINYSESYSIKDIKKYTTPSEDMNLDIDYLKDKINRIKTHLSDRHLNRVLPIGSIVFFIRNNADKVLNKEGNIFVLCNGKSHNADEYPRLANKINGKNETNKFTVPDLMDKVIVIGDDITERSEINKVSGNIESIEYDILKQSAYDSSNEKKDKAIARFNQELAKRGPFAYGSTSDDKKTYGLITGPRDIWYRSSKLGSETKPINTTGLNQILKEAAVEFDKKMINHLYVIPYIVADEYEYE